LQQAWLVFPVLYCPLRCKESPQRSSRISRSSGTEHKEIRSADYLQRVKSEKNLPKKTVSLESYQPSPSVQISPMPLAERLRRNIVPRRGFCSLAPGGDALISGNGVVSIEVMGDPYTERIPFRHENLFMPRRRPFEASKIADIFPQVRQMILDGKYHEAAKFAYNEWHKTPISRGMGGFGGGGSSMLLEFPGSESVMDYLRTVDFGGSPQYGMSSEELLSEQRSRPDYSPALMEKIFEMGRYWFILNSGKYPGIAAGINYTINLQTAGAVQGDLREGMEAYFKWMEEITPDCRNNAKNIYGFRGTSYPLFPDKGFGVNFYYTASSGFGIWPYWISAGGWCVRHFWDYYLVTGDVEFLRNRVVPAYKELAQFYEDFLTITDNDGNYIFVPSISPENIPRSTVPSGPVYVNATMDISVCREVLINLITACETLGVEGDNVIKWKTILAKLPPYLLEPDGTLKEWAWPDLDERYNHRHISQCYGAWPGDEIDPDRTPQLAKAAVMAARKQVPERLASHSHCQRTLVAARLKDRFMVDTQLRLMIEQGFVGTTLLCPHDPYAGFRIADAQGGINAIMMEMLAYSRPGVIEVIPALPPALEKGSINGMLTRTFAIINKLAWDMQKRTVDITITSLKKQDITLIVRYGIEDISAPSGITGKFRRGNADCELHLPEKRPVEINLELGDHKPLDWVAQVSQQAIY